MSEEKTLRFYLWMESIFIIVLVAFTIINTYERKSGIEKSLEAINVSMVEMRQAINENQVKIDNIDKEIKDIKKTIIGDPW